MLVGITNFGCAMFEFELSQVALILIIFRRLFVITQLIVVFFFGSRSLPFALVSNVWRQDLPTLPD